MALTEEQKERIRQNRERALEIKRRRQQERGVHSAQSSVSTVAEGKKRYVGEGSGTQEVKNAKRFKVADANGGKENDGEQMDEDLEQFEEGGSDLVSKQEAKKMYCLPEGTLAVCEVVEKDNPHNRGWAKMKLYRRSEVRRRARARYGGKEGLIAERRKREEGRFQNDIQKTKNIFQK